MNELQNKIKKIKETIQDIKIAKQAIEKYEKHEVQWRIITGLLDDWIKGKDDFNMTEEELIELITENLDQEKIELWALENLGVVGKLIDQRQLWRLNLFSSPMNFNYVSDLIKHNKEWLVKHLSDWRAEYLESFINEWLGKRQSQVISFQIRECLKICNGEKKDE